MAPGRSGLTLAERSALSGAGTNWGGTGQPVPGPAADTYRTSAGCPRHCWVTDLSNVPGRWPGLALEWQRAADRSWACRVAYAIRDGDQVVLVETWVPARHLQPADG